MGERSSNLEWVLLTSRIVMGRSVIFLYSVYTSPTHANDRNRCGLLASVAMGTEMQQSQTAFLLPLGDWDGHSRCLSPLVPMGARPSGEWRYSARHRILGHERPGWCYPTGRCTYLPSVTCYRQSIKPPPPPPPPPPDQLTRTKAHLIT